MSPNIVLVVTHLKRVLFNKVPPLMANTFVVLVLQDMISGSVDLFTTVTTSLNADESMSLDCRVSVPPSTGISLLHTISKSSPSRNVVFVVIFGVAEEAKIKYGANWNGLKL